MFTQVLSRIAEVATAPHGVDAFVAPLRRGWGDDRSVASRPVPSTPTDRSSVVPEAGTTLVADPLEVTFSASEVTAGSEGETILELAEAEGLTPRFGCRRGVCRRCTRPKVDGQVRDLRTGDLTGPGAESIQICVSVPATPVTIDL